MTEPFTLSDGTEISLPLVADDALACFGTFLADRRALPELPGPLRPVALGAKTACVVMVADYRRMSIGPYHEMVVMAPVVYRGGGRPPTRRGVFVHEIAVTSEVSRLTGREVWGFPKYMAEININEEGPGIRVTVKSERSSFELSIPRWGLPVPASAPLPVFTELGGKLLLSYIKMRGMMRLSAPYTAKLISTGETSTLSFLGASSRAIASAFMKVSNATLGAPAFEEKIQ